MINLHFNWKKNLSILLFLILTLSFSWAGPVSQFGSLYVDGNKIKSANTNQPVELKGFSSHGLQWFPFHKDTVSNMVSSFGVDVVRAAMYVKEWDGEKNYWAGYLGIHGDVIDQVKMVVEEAIKNDIYVIVDWHIHWNPNRTSSSYTAEAKSFFYELANTPYNGKLYKDYPNVIWEVMNEPGDGISWGEVKYHANQVIDEIRNIAGDTDNLILVPPKNWAQNLDEIAYDNSSDRPDRVYNNIAYTLHFYANSHFSDLRSKAEVALNNGLAVFVSEWGTGSSDGNGTPNYSSSMEWVNWMDQHDISWTSWSFCNKSEATATLTYFYQDNAINEADWAANRDNRQSGPWGDDEITQTGKWIRDWIGNKSQPAPTNTPTPTQTPPPEGGTGESASNPVAVSCPNKIITVDLSRGYAWIQFNETPSFWEILNDNAIFNIRIENPNNSFSESSGTSWYYNPSIQDIKSTRLLKIIRQGDASTIKIQYNTY